MVTFSNHAVNDVESGSSNMGALPGDQLTVRDCLYGLMLASANECANALAEHCSGSIEAFADVMNQKAAELGCTGSNFANPSGLNNENHYVTARDMALITKAAIENPCFWKSTVPFTGSTRPLSATQIRRIPTIPSTPIMEC